MYIDPSITIGAVNTDDAIVNSVPSSPRSPSPRS